MVVVVVVEVFRSEPRRPTVYMYRLILERRPDGVPGANHGVGASFIQLLGMLILCCCSLLTSVLDHSLLVDMIHDST